MKLKLLNDLNECIFRSIGLGNFTAIYFKIYHKSFYDLILDAVIIYNN